MINNVLEYLEHSAAVNPDKIAFADKNKSCTYKELVEKSKIIGSHLAKNFEPQTPIPVFMEKNVECIFMFLGIVYSGCFYVMLDIKHPASRLKQIFDILDSDIIMSSQNYETELKELQFSGKVLKYEDIIETEPDNSLLSLRREQALDIDILYGIFTSGSTGIPKGVVVSHRSVIDFIENFTELFDISSEDVIGNQAPFDFDVSVKDIYSTLKTGATMQIIPRQLFSFPTKLIDYLCDREVTTLIWAVSALCIITTLNGFEYKVPGKINKVLFSGEVMPIKHLNKWREAYPEAIFVNLYGPTEITCNCTYYIIDRDFEPGDILPIGKPFPNEKVFLLDENNSLVKESNVKGEICVSGTALSMGYYNNWEQTKKSFIQNPLNKKYNELIYRTGDLAFYNEKFELCFASRKDFQIKHMGQRIELGEIEAGIDAVPEIDRVCCLFDEKSNKIIAVYEGEIEKKAIVQSLKNKLPVYMVPNVFHQVEYLPVTKNGKIDRNRLKEEYVKEE